MPTKEQIDAAVEHINDVIGRNYIEGDGDMCSCWFQPEGGGPVGMTVFQGVPTGTPESFSQIPAKAKVELLQTYVRWEGFTVLQESNVIRRVLDGQSADEWMNGIEPDDVTKKPETGTDLAAELRADYQAARVRDYGPEDAATYEGRVKEGAAMMDEFDRMMHDHGTPRFDKEEGIDR